MAGEPVEPAGALSTLTDDEWDRMIKIHLYGTFHGTPGGAPAHGAGPVGRDREPRLDLRAPSAPRQRPSTPPPRTAIVRLTRSVGLEVAPLGIHVNAVAPGFIDTPLLAPIDDDAGDARAADPAAAGSARRTRWPSLVRFLAGAGVAYCFGEVLTLTGGYSV